MIFKCFWIWHKLFYYFLWHFMLFLTYLVPMNGFVFGFCITCLSALFWPAMLPNWWIPIGLILALILLAKAPLFSGALLATFWMSVYFYTSTFQLNDIPTSNTLFTVKIISLVSVNRDWISIDVEVTESKLNKVNVEQTRDADFIGDKFRLSWQQPPQVKVGQIWQIETKLKPITSIMNQGGFNQQRYYINRHIQAKGRIKRGHLVDYQPTLRQLWLNQFTSYLADFQNKAIILALMFGDKSLISPERWQQLRQTGTGHLIAISGLHLSVIFGLFYWTTQFILLKARWSLCLLRTLNVHQGRLGHWVALCCAISAAWFYAYLSGYAVSTQRALFMLLIWGAFSLLKHHHSAWQKLVYAMFLVLLVDPFAMLSGGFWLSFIALMIIFSVIDNAEFKTTKHLVTVPPHASHRLGSSSTKWLQVKANLINFISSLWAVQWRLSLGLGLLQIVLFGTLSLNSIWINLFAVPWFSVLVIPVTMMCLIIGLLLSPFLGWFSALSLFYSKWLFNLPDQLLSPFVELLSLAEQFTSPILPISEAWVLAIMYSLFSVVLIQLAGGFSTLFKQVYRLLFGGRYSNFANENTYDLARLAAVVLLNIPLMLQATFYVTNSFADELASPFYATTVELHVLDVAQGSAIVIQQGQHAILYDTGAAFGDFSYAKRAILPFLDAKGIQQLDYLIVSHLDNDHSGGVKDIVERFNTTHIISDGILGKTPELRNYPQLTISPCTAGTISWGNVTVTVLNDNLQSDKSNNQSCVVKLAINHTYSGMITTGQSKQTDILLTGDIESEREFNLLEHAQKITADIVFVPHHGSKTSSTEAFIAAVNPRLAIINAGFENRYGFPKKQVLDRYQAKGITCLTTGELGQLSIKFNQDGYHVSSYRRDLAPFWYNRLFRFGEIVKAE
ncbi:ComEC/Rec2 family competence protein [Shewanella gaetbuli]